MIEAIPERPTDRTIERPTTSCAWDWYDFALQETVQAWRQRRRPNLGGGPGPCDEAMMRGHQAGREAISAIKRIEADR